MPVSPSEVLIDLEGVFDGPTARRVEANLISAAPGTRVRIDLTKVREFQDFGVAILGHAVTRCRADVVVRGLRQHQLRVLQYFGLDPARLAGRLAPDPA
jgi:anti-anti-sigma regulatory factor